MALKDMKSDLSKFRMPKKEPLESKERVDVRKNQNQTPLSSMVDSAPKIPRSQTTTNKEGVNPQKVNQTEKFKGETSVKPMNLEERFLGETEPNKMDNSEKFLGETNPTPMDNSEKFLGETNPSKMDNSEKFLGQTTPDTMDNSPNYLGETNPNKMDNSEKFLGETTTEPMNRESKFLGETNPNKMDNSERFLGETTPTSAEPTSQFLGETSPKSAEPTSKFLGETTPTEMDNSEKFLGETTPTTAEPTSKFLGETTPTPMSLEERYLGETTPNKVNQNEKFKGETDPTKFDNTSNFVRFSNEQISSPFATEPNQMNLDAKFLGETTPTPTNLEERFLGETDPTLMSLEQRFLGETTPTEMGEQTGDTFLGETNPNVMSLGDKFKGETTPARFPYILRQENEGKEPGEVNYFSDIHATGFTSKFESKDQSKFVGINPDNTQFDGATSLYGTLGLTNFIVDDDATGFTKDMFPIGSSKKPSQFTGVDSAGTVFDEKSSEYSNTKSLYNGLSYRPGYGKFKFDKETGNVQRYSESNKYLIDNELTRLGISQLQEMRSSPSFLDEMYHKFNLRDDAFNLGTAAFAHPLILRGIQRKKISKGEPQKWGFGFPVDDGLVRGGIVTATDRAVVDAVRLGKWMVSVQGLLWGIKQLGLQQATANVESTNGKRKTKIWTPINTLATTLGGFAGLHANRHGITPFDLTKGTYSEVLDAKRAGHGDDYMKLTVGPFANRLVNTWFKDRNNLPNGDVKDKGEGGKLIDKLKNAFSGGPNSLYGLGDFAPNQSTETTIPKKQDGELGRTYNPLKQYNPTAGGPSPSGTSGFPFEPDNTELGKKAKKLPDSFKNNTKNTEGNSHPIEKNDTAAELIKNYETIAYGDIPTRKAGDPSVNDFRKDFTTKLGYRDTDYSNEGIESRTGLPNHAFSIGKDKSDYNNPNFTVRDEINALDLDQEGNDLIQFWIKADGGSKTQFRGTVSGITETFSPSWDSFKYNGRADQAYKYTTFERSLSLNFKAYASSRAEMKPMYKKLQYLATMTMPEYKSGGYHGTLVTFRLGDLYNGKLAFIESLTYTLSDETPWDIDMDGNLGELPMGVDIAIGFKILDGIRPQLGAGIYDWSQI